MVVTVPKTETRVYEFFGVKDDSLPVFYLADMSNPRYGRDEIPFFYPSSTPSHALFYTVA